MKKKDLRERNEPSFWMGVCIFLILLGCADKPQWSENEKFIQGKWGRSRNFGSESSSEKWFFRNRTFMYQQASGELFKGTYQVKSETEDSITLKFFVKRQGIEEMLFEKEFVLDKPLDTLRGEETMFRSP